MNRNRPGPIGDYIWNRSSLPWLAPAAAPDFEPVARLPSNPYVVVARKDLPATDLKDLIAWLRANPDKATEGTAGPGSGQHVSGIYFQEVTRTRFQFVQYR